jgi:hypothetical protein
VVTILAGTVVRVDAKRRVIGIGRNEVWVPRHISLAEVMRSDTLSTVCEEREGRYWLLSFQAGIRP